MEGLIIAVNQIAELLKGNKTTFILSIILTIMSIILSVRMDRQNGRLQKDIANRGSINQARQIVLNIYDAFFVGGQVASQANGCVDEMFTSEQSYYKWAADVQNASSAISQMYNQAKLLIKDDDFVNSLKMAYNAFNDFNTSVYQYISTGFPSQTINNAWTHVYNKFGLVYGNYYALLQNHVWHEEFRRMCKTSDIDAIQERLEKYLAVVGDDAFDNHFKQYISIQKV